MNENAPPDTEQNRKKSWIRVVEWASVIGGILAVLSFFGYPTLQSVLPHVSFNPLSWIEWLHPPPSPPPPPPPPQQRSPQQSLPSQSTSSLAGQSWTFGLDGHNVRLDFKDNGVARFSDPAFGDDGRWTLLGKKAGAGDVVRIETSQRIVFATQEANGNMTAMIYRQEGQRAVLDRTIVMTHIQ